MTNKERLLWGLFGAVSAFQLLGCADSIAVKEHHARLDAAEFGGWLMAHEEGRNETLRELGVVKAGMLGYGDETLVPLDIAGAHRSLVIAACDRDCRDLDIRVETVDGRLVGIDDDEDDRPQVKITAGKAEKLRVRVRMADCRAGRCAFAIRQFEYEDYVQSVGTCFAVAPDGLLMTSLHVVNDAEKITVALADGRRAEARILRRSRSNDLALLKTELATPDWLPLAGLRDITVSMPAFAVGFPSPIMLGSEAKFTEGTVSSLSGFKDDSTLLQVSIPIQRGSSGSPVVSDKGMVLGVMEAVVEEDDDGTPMQLTNFARNAHVASLLLPARRAQRNPAPARTRDEAVARAMAAVCQVETE